jgi:hypothetical protein
MYVGMYVTYVHMYIGIDQLRAFRKSRNEIFFSVLGQFFFTQQKSLCPRTT